MFVSKRMPEKTVMDGGMKWYIHCTTFQKFEYTDLIPMEFCGNSQKMPRNAANKCSEYMYVGMPPKTIYTGFNEE